MDRMRTIRDILFLQGKIAREKTYLCKKQAFKPESTFAQKPAKVFKSRKCSIQSMKYRAKIEVSLKPGHSDPEGETTARLLRELGYKIDTVNVSKEYNIIIESSNHLKEAKVKAEEMCKRVLANPTKDNYTVHMRSRDEREAFSPEGKCSSDL